VHNGNQNATGGPLDVGPIYAGVRPGGRVPGYSLLRVRALHDEIREVASERLAELMRAFAARMRQAGQP
jgi:hypothetical protein